MVATAITRPALNANPSADSPNVVDPRPTTGYLRLYRRVALLRVELLRNIAAASQPSTACSR